MGVACIYAPGNEQFAKGEPERVVTVDADYISMHTPLVASRLKQAGVRLAHLLNTTLEAKEIDDRGLCVYALWPVVICPTRPILSLRGSSSTS